jgi:hypothetical protein
MNNFVKENWYKLMVGSSMMMVSFGFMIYAISPAYSNSEKDKTEIKNTNIPNAPISSNGVIVGEYVYFVDGGYIYKIRTISLNGVMNLERIHIEASNYKKTKLP